MLSQNSHDIAPQFFSALFFITVALVLALYNSDVDIVLKKLNDKEFYRFAELLLIGVK